MAGERLINYIQQIRGLLNPFSATVIRLGDKQATDLKTPPSSEAAAYLLEEDNVIFVESRGTANFKIGEIPITIKDTKRGAHVVVGNEENGRLVRVSTISNDSGTASGDTISFYDVFTEETITASAPSTEGTTTVILGGKTYTVTYAGTSSSDTNWIKLNYPDSTTATRDIVLYPTIKTSKGAKLAFYEPATINLTNWDGNDNNVSTIKFPDGDGYTDVSSINKATAENWTFSKRFPSPSSRAPAA